MDTLYHICKACEDVNACYQDILNTTVFQSVHNRKPELCVFILSNPHTEDFFNAVHIDANCNVYSLFDDLSFTANVKVYCVHETTIS